MTQNGKVELNTRQHYIYNLKSCIHNHMGEYDKDVYYHKETEVEYRPRRNIFYEDCDKGLLCKPCSVCGYQYGTSWNYEPIPKEDEAIIYRLLESKALYNNNTETEEEQ